MSYDAKQAGSNVHTDTERGGRPARGRAATLPAAGSLTRLPHTAQPSVYIFSAKAAAAAARRAPPAPSYRNNNIVL